MTTFITRQGDILNDDADVLVNPVNCRGVMGAGLAEQFKRLWPEMYADYRIDCEMGLLSPGIVHLWQDRDSPVIVNVPTKDNPYERSVYVNVADGITALRNVLVELIEERGTLTVAIPALGCGRGGLDWGAVEPTLRARLDGVEGLEVRLYPPNAHAEVS